jgi:hypothetical protein
MDFDERHTSRSEASNSPKTDFTCPKCGALLYSQKSKICGKCGAVVPPELILTDEKAAALHKERQWARELADAFDTTGRAKRREGHDTASESARSRYETALTSPEELIRSSSCISEFKHRKRPTWFYAICCAFTLLVTALFFGTFGAAGQMNLDLAVAWIFFSALAVLSWFVLWYRGMPICPNCKQNIRTCLTEYCHVCGKPLSHKRCMDCGVDNSWTGWFRPYGNGLFKRIVYCPGCGVELDTWIHRWRADD